MQYYIGYFQQLNMLSKEQLNTILPISTALYQPKWLDIHYEVFDELSPRGIKSHDECPNCDHSKAKFEHGFHTYSCGFLKFYFTKLCNLDWSKLQSKIQTAMFMTNYKDVAIMVYEKPDNPCSERWPLIWSFKKYLDIDLIDMTTLVEK